MALPPLILNPNWPPISVEVDFTTGPPGVLGPARLSINARDRQLTVHQITIKAGRQYETGTFDAGTASISLLDPLELLNPANTSSPFNTGPNLVDAYRAIGIYAYWPLAGNLWTANVAAGFDPSFETSVAALSQPGGTTVALSTAQAWTGAHSALVTQASAASGAWPTVAIPTVPGAAHTVSIYVYPTSTASVTLSVTDESGTVQTSAAAATAGVWQRISVTFTAADCLTMLTIAGTGAATPTYYLDGAQYQFGSLVTAWSATGPIRYPLFTGYVEQWPPDWDKGGNRGVRQLECVDALAILSRTEILQSYAATIATDSPALVIPYNDAAGPQAVQRPTGGQPITGWSLLGSKGNPTINFAGDTTLDGSPAASIVQQNANPVVAADTSYVTYLATRGGQLAANTAKLTLELWVKWTAGTIWLGAGATQTGENIATEAGGPTYFIGWSTAQGQLKFSWWTNNPSTSNYFFWPANQPWNGYPDGQWHYLATTLYASGALATTIDGQETDFVITNPVVAVALDNFFAMANTYFGDPVSKLALANLAVYNKDIGSNRRNAHYQRGIGYAGEVSGARIARLLSQYWGNNYTAAPGVLQLAADISYHTRMMLDVLQEITASENGQCYATRAGVVAWEDRTSRYLSQSPKYVFGERADLGEIPYTLFKWGFDPTYTYSQANLSRPDSNTTLVYPNPPPASPRYGQRILSQTIQCTNDFDLTTAAQFYTNRYARPALRVKAFSFEPSSLNSTTVPGAWPAALGMEISQRHTTTRRTPAGVVMTGDQYVESLNHKIDAKALRWTVDLEMSPVFVPTAWVLGDSTYGVLGSTTVPVY